MDKEHFYQKTWFKNAILVGVPTIISALGVVLSVITNNVAKAVIVAINIFLFIIFAIFISDKKYKEKYFWILTALFFLIASFGRYFPLIYGALFQIPIFQDARNPNKFIEIIPIPFAIISSFAADYIFNAIELKTKKENNLLKYLEEDY